MDEFEDDSSEFSSISSCPSSPRNTVQNQPELEDISDMLDIDRQSDTSQILSSRSVSLVPTGTPY